jgi:deoxyadenosine/deoxycytidine kinase
MIGKIASLRIAIVGPCAAGKSTLASGLQSQGLQARQIVQEHSYVPEMWQHFDKPDVLIYLDASYEVCTKRKKLNWLPKEYAEQLRRLEHAREHCQIYINTDDLTPAEVLERVLNALEVAYPTA